MPSIITDVGRNFIAQEVAAGRAVDITTVKFSDVTHPDPANPPVPPATMTDLDPTIVHTALNPQAGKIDPDNVAYTAYLDTTVGDFEITQVGYFADDGGGGLVLIMVSNVPTVYKRANGPGQTGNNYKHTEILQIAGAAAAVAVTVPPATWQLDFTAELMRRPPFDVVVGSQAQVDAGQATHTIGEIDDTTVPAGARVVLLEGTHTLAANLALNNADVVLVGENAAAILDVATFTLTLAGARTHGALRVSNAGAGDVIVSGAGAFFIGWELDIAAVAVSNGAIAVTSGADGGYKAPDNTVLQQVGEKGQANGYAGLDGTGKLAQNLDASKVTSGTLGIARIPTIDDTRHGNRSGGNLHALAVAAGAAGFLSGADKAKLDGIDAGATAGLTRVVLTGSGNWNVPAGISAILAILVGGAGGGGAGGGGVPSGGAGGGGGGGVEITILEVTPGGTLAYSVGSGGLGATSAGNNGGDGGDTTLDGGYAGGGVNARGGDGGGGGLAGSSNGGNGGRGGGALTSRNALNGTGSGAGIANGPTWNSGGGGGISGQPGGDGAETHFGLAGQGGSGASTGSGGGGGASYLGGPGGDGGSVTSGVAGDGGGIGAGGGGGAGGAGHGGDGVDGTIILIY